jgi:HK97 gp10 family phage protein
MVKRVKYANVSLDLNMDDILAAVEDNLDAAMFLGAMEVLEASKPKTPLKRGKLRESGYVSTASRSSYAGGKGHRKEIKPKKRGEAAIAFSYFTARFFELGTKHLAARPFLRPGFDEKKDSARDTVINLLKEAINK